MFSFFSPFFVKRLLCCVCWMTASSIFSYFLFFLFFFSPVVVYFYIGTIFFCFFVFPPPRLCPAADPLLEWQRNQRLPNSSSQHGKREKNSRVVSCFHRFALLLLPTSTYFIFFFFYFVVFLSPFFFHLLEPTAALHCSIFHRYIQSRVKE